MVGIIGRDMLENGGFAERHEEAEHEDRDDEADEAHLGMERDRPPDAMDDIVGGRIGQDERRRDRDQERPVKYAPCPEAVREMPAIGAEEASRYREERRDHAGRLDVEAIDVDEILRKPERQRDEGA